MDLPDSESGQECGGSQDGGLSVLNIDLFVCYGIIFKRNGSRIYVMTDNTRKYVRAPFPADATLLVLNNPGNVSIQIRIRDISFAGAGVSSPQAVDTGKKVAITIKLDNGEKKEIVEGIVAWKIELRNEYDLGIYFSHAIEPTVHPLLHGIINAG